MSKLIEYTEQEAKDFLIILKSEIDINSKFINEIGNIVSIKGFSIVNSDKKGYKNVIVTFIQTNKPLGEIAFEITTDASFFKNRYSAFIED